MGDVYFYHLTREPVEVTLPALLAKARNAGWRVVVRGTSEDRLDWLDEELWLGEGFLPHGRAGGPHDADQPILLTSKPDSPNAAHCLMAIDAAPVAADEIASHDRTCILFDGNDTNALEAARTQWRDLTAAGCAAQYWSQESGRWQKKAEA